MILCEIVSELDKYIIGQDVVKCFVVIVLCNCWCWMQFNEELCYEVMLKNILMIGLIGVGKIEIVCCLVKLVNVLFIKVEVMKFIEVGYVGKEVDFIICDLIDVVIKMVCMQFIDKNCYCVEELVEECVFDVLILLVKNNWGQIELLQELFVVCQVFCKKLCEGQLDDKEIEIDFVVVLMGVEIMFFLGMEEMISQLQFMFQNFGGQKQKLCKLKIKDVMKLLIEEEVVKLVNLEELKQEVIDVVEQYGIVFIDEIDKICKCGGNIFGLDVFCEGVQCDLLLLVEGCIVFIKYGMVKIDYILFIVFGVFQVVSLFDLILELQGCLLICVELKVLIIYDFECILIELNVFIIVQYKVLMVIEGVNIEFIEDGIKCIVQVVWQVNEIIENIGVCCLYIVLECLVEDIFYDVSEMNGQIVIIDVEYVSKYLDVLVVDEDLSCFIL